MSKNNPLGKQIKPSNKLMAHIKLNHPVFSIGQKCVTNGFKTNPFFHQSLLRYGLIVLKTSISFNYSNVYVC